MTQILVDIENVFVYLDDVIIFNEDLEDHMNMLSKVLKRLHIAGLKTKTKKCQFLMKKLNYLGHIVNEEGIQI